MRAKPACLRLLLAAGLMLGSLGARAVPGAVAQSATTNCDVADPDRALAADETQMLSLHNQYRAQVGLNALQVDSVLMRAARWKAAALAASNAPGSARVDHDDPFRSWEQRFIDCGYSSSLEFSENLGETQLGPEDLLPVWKASQFHAGNMVNPNFKYVGVARGSNGRSNFWVITFGNGPGDTATRGSAVPSDTEPSNE